MSPNEKNELISELLAELRRSLGSGDGGWGENRMLIHSKLDSLKEDQNSLRGELNVTSVKIDNLRSDILESAIPAVYREIGKVDSKLLATNYNLDNLSKNVKEKLTLKYKTIVGIPSAIAALSALIWYIIS